MKRSDSSSPPILSWCMIVRNSAAPQRDGHTLEDTLKSLRERTPDAEIVIVDTMSNDGGKTAEIAQKYADVYDLYAGPDGTWTEEMDWFDDAAAARQHSFELASGLWRGWVDDDDILPGPDEVERLLKLNGRWRPAGGKVMDGDASEPVSLTTMLADIAKNNPEVTMLWCPYLYERDDHDVAIVWQTRERFVRWDVGFRWANPLHEELVPIASEYPQRADIDHLLFVHQALFTPANVNYAYKRHYDVGLKLYEKGERTVRNCLYLAAYAVQLAPEREAEFIETAVCLAATPTDKFRAFQARASWRAKRGLYWDALADAASAIVLRPELPDAYFTAADIAISAEDWLRAADFLGRGVTCDVGQPASYVPPATQLVDKQSQLAYVCVSKIAPMMRKQSNFKLALEYLQKGEEIYVKLLERATSKAKAAEIAQLYKKARNERRGEQFVQALHEQMQYLKDNDEPVKAIELLAAVPHNQRHHPLVLAQRIWARSIYRHVSDHDAYIEFYNDDQATGAISSADSWVDDQEFMLDRVRRLAKWINLHKPTARVFDYGCFDGIFGLALLKLCPGIKYTGADMNAEALERFKQRVEERGYSPRVTFRPATSATVNGPVVEAHDQGAFDVVIATEIIEHVPLPVVLLDLLSRLLSRDGRLFITTPWNAYDDGTPPETTDYGTPRGHRGHLRAYAPETLLAHADIAALQPETLVRSERPYNAGDEIHALFKHDYKSSVPRTHFVVPGALWDWNASTVKAQGMGASEECIVYLAENLHGRSHVYGPVPQPEVNNSVTYLPREELFYVDNVNRLVVSRAPSYINQINEQVQDLPNKPHLWLQDAWYPDLNTEIAERYERIIVVSKWHKQAMHERHGVPLDQMDVRYNSFVAEQFGTEALRGVRREGHHFIYASSPDRGLIALLKLWPRIRDMYPDATLAVFYGWRGCKKLAQGGDAWAHQFTALEREYSALARQPGVHEYGMVPHAVLAREFARAAGWLYPTHFEETGCLTAAKARAAGTVPVTSALAALNETARCEAATLIDPRAEDYDELFLAGVKQAVETSNSVRKQMAERARDEFGLHAVLPGWEDLLDA